MDKSKAINAVSAIFMWEDRYLIMDHVKLGEWCFPCGKIDEGESPVNAVSREMKEELAVDIREVRFLTALPRKASYGPSIEYTCYFYLITNYQGTPINNEPDKCRELRWVTKEALLTMYGFADFDVVERFLK